MDRFIGPLLSYTTTGTVHGCRVITDVATAPWFPRATTVIPHSDGSTTMTIPGFHAEASARGRAGRYTTGRPAPGPRTGAAGERIVPMFTDEERDVLIQCGGALDRCFQECEPLIDNYYVHLPCITACNEQYDRCVEPVFGS
ncbi:hypothetical protein GCM10009730_45290 [Streptomyces albidochromogenes]|uniref:hypothetical protein n=1 Tax=Streptomyces albidochromogenes TaxID=329524 RepID=UPI001FCA65F5|nr:hypothetical protein [Streptomyces albidochromogenes]